MVWRLRLGKASLYRLEEGTEGAMASSSVTMIQGDIGMGGVGGRWRASWRSSTGGGNRSGALCALGDRGGA